MSVLKKIAQNRLTVGYFPTGLNAVKQNTLYTSYPKGIHYLQIGNKGQEKPRTCCVPVPLCSEGVSAVCVPFAPQLKDLKGSLPSLCSTGAS